MIGFLEFSAVMERRESFMYFSVSVVGVGYHGEGRGGRERDRETDRQIRQTRQTKQTRSESIVRVSLVS